MPSSRQDPTDSELEEIHADNERFLEELRAQRDEMGPRQAQELAEQEQALAELRRRHRGEREELDEWIVRVERKLQYGEPPALMS